MKDTGERSYSSSPSHVSRFRGCITYLFLLHSLDHNRVAYTERIVFFAPPYHLRDRKGRQTADCMFQRFFKSSGQGPTAKCVLHSSESVAASGTASEDAKGNTIHIDPVPSRFRRKGTTPTEAASDSMYPHGVVSTPTGDRYSSKYFRVPLRTTSAQCTPLYPPSASHEFPVPSCVLSIEKAVICQYCRRPVQHRRAIKEERRNVQVIREDLRALKSKSSQRSSSLSSSLTTSCDDDDQNSSTRSVYCQCGRTRREVAEPTIPVYLVQHQSGDGHIPGTLKLASSSSSSEGFGSTQDHAGATSSHPFAKHSTTSLPAYSPVSRTSSGFPSRFKYAVVSPLTASSLNNLQKQMKSVPASTTSIGPSELPPSSTVQPEGKGGGVRPWLEDHLRCLKGEYENRNLLDHK